MSPTPSSSTTTLSLLSLLFFLLTPVLATFPTISLQPSSLQSPSLPPSPSPSPTPTSLPTNLTALPDGPSLYRIGHTPFALLFSHYDPSGSTILPTDGLTMLLDVQYDAARMMANSKGDRALGAGRFEWGVGTAKLRLSPNANGRLMTWLGLSHVVMGIESFTKRWEWVVMDFSVLVDGTGVVAEGAVMGRAL